MRKKILTYQISASFQQRMIGLSSESLNRTLMSSRAVSGSCAVPCSREAVLSVSMMPEIIVVVMWCDRQREWWDCRTVAQSDSASEQQRKIHKHFVISNIFRVSGFSYGESENKVKGHILSTESHNNDISSVEIASLLGGIVHLDSYTWKNSRNRRAKTSRPSRDCTENPLGHSKR